MHRQSWHRAVIALWGLWFTTALVDPAGILSCTMHGAPLASSTLQAASEMAAATTAGSQGGDDNHAHHDAAAGSAALVVGTTAAATGTNAPPPSPHECCTCMGRCCTAAATGTPRARVLEATCVRRGTAPIARSGTERPNAERPHALPFANGPPEAVHG